MKLALPRALTNNIRMIIIVINNTLDSKILQHCIYKFNTISTVNIVTAIVFFIIIMTGAIFMISIRVGFVVIIFIFFIRCLIPANLRPTSKTAQDIFLITFKFLDYGLELN